MSSLRSLALIVLCVAAAFLLALGDRYWMDVFILTCFYGTLAVAWNLMAGMTGLMSLGHSLFVGIGAYTVAFGQSRYGWSPLLTWPLAIALSLAAAATIGALCFRYGLRGYFFAIATLAFSEVAFFAVSATDALGRSDGMIIPTADDPWRYLQFFEKWPYGLIVATILILTMTVSTLLLRSRPGYYWRAMRDNEEAAATLGVDVARYKMLSFLVSAGVAGLCGAFYANYVAFVDPRSVLGVDLSIQMLVFSIIGGTGQVWGPLLGAALLVPLGDVLRSLTTAPGAPVIVYALLLVVLALVLPQGIAGWLTGRFRRARASQRVQEPAE